MPYRIFLVLLVAAFAAGCTKPAPSAAVPSADVVRTSFPDTLTTESIYLGDTQLPAGTRFNLLQLPTGQRLEINLPEGTQIDLRKPDGSVERTGQICFACECFQDSASCEVALYNVQGGQLGFLQGNCGAEVIAWYCKD